MLLISILSTSGYDRTNERWRKVEWQKRRTSSWEWSRARGIGGGRLKTCRWVCTFEDVLELGQIHLCL